MLRSLLYITIQLLLAISQGAWAQDTIPEVRLFRPHVVTLPVDTPGTDTIAPQVARPPGQLTVVADERITKLMEDFSSKKQPLRGYRVQVFLGSDRNSAEKVRREFLSKHADIPAYLGYLPPNFRVRVGDLRDKVEAERMRQLLKPDYPGCYIVEDDIEMPRLREQEE